VRTDRQYAREFVGQQRQAPAVRLAVLAAGGLSVVRHQVKSTGTGTTLKSDLYVFLPLVSHALWHLAQDAAQLQCPSCCIRNWCGTTTLLSLCFWLCACTTSCNTDLVCLQLSKYNVATPSVLPPYPLNLTCCPLCVIKCVLLRDAADQHCHLSQHVYAHGGRQRMGL
jgi:hypothetical protein